jgi:hypothetical protein
VRRILSELLSATPGGCVRALDGAFRRRVHRAGRVRVHSTSRSRCPVR